MANASLSKQFDNFPWIFRVIIQLFCGALFSGIYRIIRFTETQNMTLLVVGLIALVTGIGNLVFWLIDLVSLITNGKYTMFVD